MRLEPTGSPGNEAYFRYGTGAMRRARAAVSVGPLSGPVPVEPATKTGKAPNSLYDPSGKPAEPQTSRPRGRQRVDIKV